MPASDIVVKGAREHNLRDVSLTLPRNKLICLTGVSGSGKSSLAFDTLYAEGQRRYVESLSSFARQFLGQMPKPDVDLISGLSPSISISQKSTGNNPRSTVGTITEIYDYLRVLFARVSQGHCPECGEPITAQTREQIIEQIMALETGTKYSVLAPIIRGQKGEYRDLFEDLLKQGYIRARVDGEIVSLSDDLNLDRQMRHNIELVIDRLSAKPSIRGRLAEAVDTAIKVGKGNLIVAVEEDEGRGARSEGRRAKGGRGRKRKAKSNPNDTLFSTAFACIPCGLSFEPPSPQLFSFNSPQGMCLECDGLGQLYTFDPELLIPDASLSFRDGAVMTVGSWKELGRWRRHIYQGVADTMERKLELPEGTLLETPWENLEEEIQDILLWGTGEEHITFTWRSGNSPQKYGGTYEGIIPELLSKYASTNSKMQQRALEKYMSTVRCPDCDGHRLNPQARHARVTSASELFAESRSLTLPEVCSLPVNAAADFFAALELSPTQQIIAAEALKEIRGRLGFLMNVGLDYLTLDRTAPTLSGGESQRIRLAGQIGCGLVGVLYILDEPSIGLHPRDNDRLLDTLCQLRDMGNTVLVVEHDEDTMRIADHIVDFGPGPGVRGGELVAEGNAAKIMKAKRSVTGAFLSGKRTIEIPATRRLGDGEERGARGEGGDEKGEGRREKGEKPVLRIVGAQQNNLKDVDVEIPLGGFICVTGVSGSGKSSLVNDILVEALRRDLNHGEAEPGTHERIEGLQHLDKMIAIDQSPIGRTPRSNPGTYIKVFDEIRKLFTQLPESKKRGYKPGRFSFNVQGGRCEACEGNGSNKLEMDFLADIWVTCPVCEGHRFNRETLGVKFKDKSIAEVLEMDVQEALELFENQPKIAHRLQTLHDVGLDYLKIGQPSPTLSGGEAQRIKLARELVKKSTGQTIYFLDEPTTGLHFADIEMLLKVLHGFADAGNTVVVVEHNLDVIKTADWIIDLGPEGGHAGGQIVVTGTPEEVAACEKSHTGRALAKVLGTGSRSEGRGATKKTDVSPRPASRAPRPSLTKVKVQGAEQHNLKHVDVDVPRDAMSVFCGPSGSGKTSLAMDTIYAEGQRRYVESLSAYARQFVGQMQKPKLEHIEGLSPAIAIEQKNLGHTPRSTVGTVTEIYDYFRILYARLGQMHCPECAIPVGTQTADEIIDKVMAEPEDTKLFLMAPVEIEVGRRYETLWEDLRAAGYNRIRVDGTTYTLEEPPEIDRRRKHSVEVVVDRVVVRASERSRIAESIENALALGRGVLHVLHATEGADDSRWPLSVHSQHLVCQSCGRSFESLTPHSFSFNSHLGWCPECEGLGTQVGANPAALIQDGKLTLAEGALALWPKLSQPIARSMLEVLASETGLPLDVPFDQLSARQKRIVMHGTEERWFKAPLEPSKKNSATFSFQFKGLYPALEEASRLSPSFRTRLEHLVDEVDCTACAGSRLRDDASAVQWRKKAIDEIGRMPLGELKEYFDKLKFNATEKRIAGELVREIKGRLQFLCDVGLEYLTLSRSAPTLSAGEAQRIRLASQLGSGLCGVLYVLDEPTIGLHPRDNTRLLGALHKLRDLGNTLLVVEHDREVIEGSDHVFDFGPAAGKLGGQIVASGNPEQLLKRRKSVTGPYLSGKKAIAVPTNRRIVAEERREKGEGRKKRPDSQARPSPLASLPAYETPNSGWLSVLGARHNNLRNVDVTIPLGTLTAVTGPSGSGKSSLVEDVLHAALAKRLHRANTAPGAHDEILGVEHINKVIRVDQKPLGNSPASNPATYTGVFELIRQLFAQLPEAKLRGFTSRRFSFNVPGGRCDDCEGDGQVCIEMHFLPDVWVECETCRGKRYNPETLAVKFHGHSIADVLEMTCGEALRLFANIPKIRRTLQTLCDVGLDYLQLGQPAPTLSGGEAQRVKLAAELSRPDTGATLYLLDEPTTGLHFDDLAKLLDVLHRLVDLGNTVVVIEHNLDVIKQADWIIDMGPEAGEGGGQVVAMGTPEEIVGGQKGEERRGKKSRESTTRAARRKKPTPQSYTAQYLAPVLAAGPHEERKLHNFEEETERREGDLDIDDVGKTTQMPWQVDGRQWHCHDRVGRRGEACKWDGRVLDRVVDRIHELGEFSETNWDSRTVVEIAAEKKSDGWFFHAITGEAWLLKMKFRVAKNTFKREELQKRIPLDTLNEMHDLPVYGNEPRVKCKNLRGPWQEVEIRAHTLEEINTDEFWKFIEEAVAGFFKHTERVQQKPEDIMPWKVLGQKWHLSRKGFPPGKKVKWETEVLEELFEMLSSVVPKGQFLWNNQVLVHLYANGHQDPWATVVTKKTDAIELRLNGPKGEFALGRIAEMGRNRELETTNDRRDTIKLSFREADDLHKGDFPDFLKEHVERL